MLEDMIDIIVSRSQKRLQGLLENITAHVLLPALSIKPMYVSMYFQHISELELIVNVFNRQRPMVQPPLLKL